MWLQKTNGITNYAQTPGLLLHFTNLRQRRLFLLILCVSSVLGGSLQYCKRRQGRIKCVKYFHVWISYFFKMPHLDIHVHKWSSYSNIICESQYDPNTAAWFKQPLDVRVSDGGYKAVLLFLRCYIFLPLSQSCFCSLTIK